MIRNNITIQVNPEREKVIVYLTVNTKNHKVYVGVHKTSSPDKFDGYLGCGISRRRPSCLLNPKTPFQYAVKKYGFDAFRRVIIKVCDTYEEALKIESIIVDEKFVNSKFTYNIALGGGNPSDCSIPCYKYDLKGNFVNEYNSVKEASEIMNLKFPTSISTAITNKTPSCGFLWSFDKVDKLDISDYYISNYNNKKNIVYLYDLNGNYVKEYESFNAATKDLGGKVSDLSLAIKSKYKFRGQYYASLEKLDSFPIPVLKRHGKNDPIYQYEINGTFIKEWKNVKTVKEYFNTTKITDSLISGRTHQGFQWSYTKMDRLPDLSNKGGRARKVGRYDDDGNLLEVFNTMTECQKQYGNVGKVLKGVVEKCKGFRFKYLEEM